MGRFGWNIIRAAALLLASLSAVSCSSSRTAHVAGIQEDAIGPALSAPAKGLPDFEELLSAEMARLSVDATKTSASAPTGKDNAVFDLAARIVDPSWPNIEFPVTVELSWTERLAGDYNQDGIVNASDLVPIGLHWQEAVRYRDSEQSGGLEHWPTGDPELPAGAINWRRARIDGSGDGLVNAADITTIAQHWREQLDGYVVYWRQPNDGNFSKLPNAEYAGAQMTMARSAVVDKDIGDPDHSRPIRYRLLLEVENEGQYTFFVAPHSLVTRAGGPAGNWAGLLVSVNAPPVASLAASPTWGNPPLLVRFDASNSHDVDGRLTKHEWDWDGDGVFDESTGAIPLIDHYIDAHGRQPVNLRITDDRGATDVAMVDLQLTDNHPPKLKYHYLITAGGSPFTVNFTLGTDDDGEIVLRELDLNNDGEFDTSAPGDEQLIHVFEQSGLHATRLRVVDDDGAASALDFIISVDPPPEDVSIEMVQSDGFESDPIVFSGAAYDQYNDIAKFEWDWEGDGEFDFEDAILGGSLFEMHWYRTSSMAVHTFQSSGTYETVMRATNSKGISASTSIPVVIQPDDGDPRWHYRFPVSLAGTSVHALAVINGLPAIAYVPWDSANPLLYIRALDTNGDRWSEPVLISNFCDIEPYFDDGNLTLIDIDNSPVVCFSRKVDADPIMKEIMTSHSMDSSGQIWSEPRSIGTNDAAKNPGRRYIDSWNHMAVVNGFPAVCYSFDYDKALYYSRALDPLGDSWTSPQVIAELPVVPRSPSLAVVNGSPAAAFYAAALCYVRATDESGNSWQDWQYVSYLGGEYPSLAVVGDRPAIAYYHHGPINSPVKEINYIRATDNLGTEWGSVNTIGTTFEKGDPFLTVISGNPAVLYRGEVLTTLALASSLSGTEWERHPLPCINFSAPPGYIVELANGRTAACYDSILTFAVYK